MMMLRDVLGTHKTKKKKMRGKKNKTGRNEEFGYVLAGVVAPLV